MRAYSLYSLATASLASGDPTAAGRYARDALTIKHRLHDLLGAAMAIDLLAAAVAVSAPASAATLLGTADVLWRSVGQVQVGMPQLMATRKACEDQRVQLSSGDGPDGLSWEIVVVGDGGVVGSLPCR
ncbi:hypothetical protein [Streptomyces longispororuber]|uniref:hypothetical protein n=1 Tax=Streptomyces longispororuber TaxID=68230 RepID=UPI00210EE8B6|nr:hypothetical protein [Streptomyces longispororuber]MCQ4206455.1 hypothetical protein [Streptomyces longispororuber]